ncbi:hypothetical protein FA95DRAFT_987270 [Auriscalpium vulgare]|uniref:Uncharacterized protein n=1 Tax=Auriscalpium vulgare TaxID=40419 RepID=A0ACB8RXG1_9AGAM|nr:hypothetical protein FA95DRAFT_987270 [Auriscalpium vulgare]
MREQRVHIADDEVPREVCDSDLVPAAQTHRTGRARLEALAPVHAAKGADIARRGGRLVEGVLERDERVDLGRRGGGRGRHGVGERGRGRETGEARVEREERGGCGGRGGGLLLCEDGERDGERGGHRVRVVVMVANRMGCSVKQPVGGGVVMGMPLLCLRVAHSERNVRAMRP